MGDAVDEYEAGTQCPNCWGVGKEWGDYPTPKRMNIIGSGFVGPEAACNGTFIATQNAVNACQFEFFQGDVSGAVQFQVLATQFNMKYMGIDVYVRAEAACVKSSTWLGKNMTIS